MGATAAVRVPGFGYPYEDLERLWKTVLLHQFHDILPGSSIAWVHREARATYDRVREELTAITLAAQTALAGTGEEELVFNCAPHERRGVPAGGAGRARAAEQPVTVEERHGGGHVLANGRLLVEVDGRGLIVSAYDLEEGREALAPGSAANLLQIHPDFPNMWDAWDVDAFYRNKVTDLTAVDSLEVTGRGPDACTVTVTRSFGSSAVTQTVTLRAGAKTVDIATDVDWHETEKFLKAAFPLDVKAERTASETQFGHVYRATHTNTSWEAAKFEICAHRWIHAEEPGWGVALLNDSTYGHDVTRQVRADGGQTTTVRLSLLRAPATRTRRPTRGGTPCASPSRPAPGSGTRCARGTRSTCPSGSCGARGRWPRCWPSTATRWWWRRSSWRRTVPGTWSCGCTSPGAAGPRPCCGPASRSRRRSRATSWSARCRARRSAPPPRTAGSPSPCGRSRSSRSASGGREGRGAGPAGARLRPVHPVGRATQAAGAPPGKAVGRTATTAQTRTAPCPTADGSAPSWGSRRCC